jgi:hypothetical protein
MLKSKGKTCMVKEQSHAKQLYLNHLCKIGLKLLEMFSIYVCAYFSPSDYCFPLVGAFFRGSTIISCGYYKNLCPLKCQIQCTIISRSQIIIINELTIVTGEKRWTSFRLIAAKHKFTHLQHVLFRK